MQRPLIWAVVVGALAGAGFWVTQAQDVPPAICFPSFTIPVYPPHARLQGIEGSVYVDYHIESNCSQIGPAVTGGSPELRDAVLRVLRSSEEYPICRGQTEDVRVTYTFALVGEPTNQWVPTFVRMHEPFVIEITTQPADLAGLGLMKIPEGRNAQ